MHIFNNIGNQYFHIRTLSCNNLFWKISNMWDNFVCCEFKDNRGSLYGA